MGDPLESVQMGTRRRESTLSPRSGSDVEESRDREPCDRSARDNTVGVAPNLSSIVLIATLVSLGLLFLRVESDVVGEGGMGNVQSYRRWSTYRSRATGPARAGARASPGGKLTVVLSDGRKDPVWLASVAQKRSFADRHNFGFEFDARDFSLWDGHQGWGILAQSISKQDGSLQYITEEDTSIYSFKDRIFSKTPWHEEGTTRAYFVDTWAKVVFGNSRVFTPNVQSQPWGWMPGTWNKVVATRRAMDYAPRDTWIWSVDSDVVIMNMSHTGLLDIIAEANAQDRDIVTSDVWNCGDGINVGSILYRNSEVGRAFVDRIIDSRAVWHQFFKGEQGAIWTLLSDDPDIMDRLETVSPRRLNARPSSSNCASDRETADRVYWKQGDFVTHLAGITGRKKLATDLLAKTGWWPSPRTDVSSAPLMSTPIPTHANALGSAFKPAEARTLVVKRGEQLPDPKPLVLGGTKVPTKLHNLSAYSSRGRPLSADPERGAVFFNDEKGWASVAILHRVLQDSARSAAPRWFILSKDRDDALQFIEERVIGPGLIFEHAHVAVNGDACAMPWLVRSSEFSRNLFLRLRDGWLLRGARIRVMRENKGTETASPDDEKGVAGEEWGSSAFEGLCALVKRNPNTVQPWVKVL